MSANEAAVTFMNADSRPTRRWSRGVAIRFVLAITPTGAFAILGAAQQHLHAH